jgi:5-(carboxyamino)imidazole ribonucleotide synthase
MREALPPGGVIGILGGGQLGRMLALAAARLGLKAHIFAPERDCPAAQVAQQHTAAAFDDAAALPRFAEAVDVVTFEFENVPAATVDILIAAGADVAPNGRALATAQDRLIEKQFVQSVGARTAPFAAVDDLASLRTAVAAIGRPSILKTRRLGYDGKGQTVLTDAAKPLGEEWDAANEKAWRELGARPSILEGFVPFMMEISVIAARGRDGAVALFDAPRNEHKGGILRRSTVPSGAPARALRDAEAIAIAMMEALDYVGVIGVEFFVLENGDVLVNEFAPRVHNSGHWTEAACVVSQFEQHIRAVARWPLAPARRHSDCVMENLIGDEADRWRALAADADTMIHLYGKSPAAEGRKMGHVTRLVR